MNSVDFGVDPQSNFPLDLQVGAVARCSKCAHMYPASQPPAIALVGHRDGEWMIQRFERRTRRSHKAQAGAGKLSPGMYEDTPSGKRFIRIYDSKTGLIQCRRCKRRLPYGPKELISRATVAIENGLEDFLA